MTESNKLVKWLKSINYKSGILYFIVIQTIVLACSFLLPMSIVPLLRFIFTEVGVLRDFVEIIAMLLLESVVRFITFFAFFKNDRRLVFKQFAISYAVTLLLRFIFSSITFFAGWSAGLAISLTGILLGRLWIDEDIKTMQDVPFWLYLVTFVVFEALVYLIAYLAHRLATKQREKAKIELINHKEQI